MLKVEIAGEVYDFPTKPTEVSFDLYQMWADGSQSEILAAALKCPLHVALKVNGQSQVELLNALIPLIDAISIDKNYGHKVMIDGHFYDTTQDIMKISFGTFEKISFHQSIPLQLAQFILGYSASDGDVAVLADKIKVEPAVNILPLAFFFVYRWNELQKFSKALTFRPKTPTQYKQDLSSYLIGSGGITRVTDLSPARLN